MQAQEIKSADDLKAWLKTLPPEQGIAAAQHIAHRAALRVLPIWLLHARSRHVQTSGVVKTAQCSFATHILCHLARQPDGERWPEYVPAAISSGVAANYIGADVHEITKLQQPVARVVGDAGLAIAAASDTARTSNSNRRLNFAVTACAAAERAFKAHTPLLGVDGDALIRALVRDALDVTAGYKLIYSPLWPDGSDPLSDEWAKAQPLLATHQGWTVFTTFYENALHGRPQNLQILLALAKQDQDFWTGPDVEVLDRIAQVVGARALALTDNVEDIVVNPDTGKLRLVSQDQIPPDILRYARRKMARALALFDGQPANQYQPLDNPLRRLRAALDDCDNLPVELFDICASESRMIATAARNQTIPSPDQDALIGEFITILRETAADILTADPATQDRLAKRNTLRHDDELLNVAQDMHDVVRQITQVSEGPLARLLPENAQTALNPDADPQDRQLAAYKLKGRVLRAARTLREIGSAIGDYKELAHLAALIVYSPQFQAVMNAILRALGLG